MHYVLFPLQLYIYYVYTYIYTRIYIYAYVLSMCRILISIAIQLNITVGEDMLTKHKYTILEQWQQTLILITWVNARPVHKPKHRRMCDSSASHIVCTESPKPGHSSASTRAVNGQHPRCSHWLHMKSRTQILQLGYATLGVGFRLSWCIELVDLL